MSWVKIDDQFPTHPKIMRAGLEARSLYITALCYSAQHLTDGFVTPVVTGLLTAMSQISNGPEAVKKLVEVGLWDECEGGYMIHDYLVYNPSSDKIRSERKANKEKLARYRGKNSASNPVTPPVTPPVTNGGSNGSPVPVPVLINTIAVPPQAPAQKAKTPKQAQHDSAIDSLVECFSKLTAIPCPNGDGPKSTTAVRWYAPLNSILTLCKKDTDEAMKLIKQAVEKMKRDKLDISAPQSIEKSVISIYGESHSGNGSTREFYT